MAKYLIAACIVFLVLPFHLRSQAQVDTILVYDIASQNTGTVLPIAFNPTVTSDFTSSYIGSMGGSAAPLSQLAPTSNLFSGSNFSRLAWASNFFNLTDYPMRTVVRLHSFYSDSLDAICTGMIVAPCLVLTSAICMCKYTPTSRAVRDFDSIRVDPAYNAGAPQPGLLSTYAKKIYVFKKHVDLALWDDMVLLELEQPIGLQTGWTGIGFNSNTNFTSGNVYHKFSYPASYQYNDSSIYYNGDTLFYNYGSIVDNPNNLVIPSTQAVGIVGQGGSSFMYTNNTDYYSLGMMNFANGYVHSRFTNAGFYQMRNIINTTICSTAAGLKDNRNNTMGLQLYPNPTRGEALLEFFYDPSQRYTLTVANALGQQLRTIPVNSGRVIVERGSLAPGVYFVSLSNDSRQTQVSKLVVE